MASFSEFGLAQYALAIVVLLVIYYVYHLFSSPNAGGERPWTSVSNNTMCIPDRYSTLEQVAAAIRKEGLESCNLIVGVDFTASNLRQGELTFNGRSLHNMVHGQMNPYEKVISVMGRTLSSFDDDNVIPAYIFGDLSTRDRYVINLKEGNHCYGFEDVLSSYRSLASSPQLKLSGPTSFAPLIDKAVSIVRETRQFHVLLIVGDGAVTNVRETTDAIVRASSYPLSIVMVGVGDGPWDLMEEFDDKLPSRKFDNFQFVNFHQTHTGEHPDANFALKALMEIPEQFRFLRVNDRLAC